MAFIMAWNGPEGRDLAPRAAGALAAFRREVYECFTVRADALFELCDAVLCCPGRVTDLARLSLAAEFRRGHGALYDGLNAGRLDVARLRVAVAALPLPAWGDGGIRLAVDVSSWLRPEAATCPERMNCFVYGRGKNPGQMVPGWPYSLVAALGPGPSSWLVLLDAVRLGPDDDAAAVTAAQLRDVVERLVAAGRWRPGDPRIVIVADAGYDPVRLSWLLADLPVTVAGRVRTGRVFHAPPPPREPGRPGAPRLHGPALRLTREEPAQAGDVTGTGTTSRGPAAVDAWQRMHPALGRERGWSDYPSDQPLPVIEGTVIRLAPARGEAMWLWASDPAADAGQVTRLWQAYLRRFDIEHMFRFLKQQLGWTRPLLRDPAAADRWTWTVLAAWNQLWLARPLAAATRLPWQPALLARELTPGRVRAQFSRARQAVGTPARPAKPAAPGPGRPKGSKNKHKAPRQPVGKRHPKRAKAKPKATTG